MAVTDSAAYSVLSTFARGSWNDDLSVEYVALVELVATLGTCRPVRSSSKVGGTTNGVASKIKAFFVKVKEQPLDEGIGAWWEPSGTVAGWMEKSSKEVRFELNRRKLNMKGKTSYRLTFARDRHADIVWHVTAVNGCSMDVFRELVATLGECAFRQAYRGDVSFFENRKFRLIQAGHTLQDMLSVVAVGGVYEITVKSSRKGRAKKKGGGKTIVAETPPPSQTVPATTSDLSSPLASAGKTVQKVVVDQSCRKKAKTTCKTSMSLANALDTQPARKKQATERGTGKVIQKIPPKPFTKPSHPRVQAPGYDAGRLSDAAKGFIELVRFQLTSRNADIPIPPEFLKLLHYENGIGLGTFGMNTAKILNGCFETFKEHVKHGEPIDAKIISLVCDTLGSFAAHREKKTHKMLEDMSRKPKGDIQPHPVEGSLVSQCATATLHSNETTSTGEDARTSILGFNRKSVPVPVAEVIDTTNSTNPETKLQNAVSSFLATCHNSGAECLESESSGCRPTNLKDIFNLDFDSSRPVNIVGFLNEVGSILRAGNPIDLPTIVKGLGIAIDSVRATELEGRLTAYRESVIAGKDVDPRLVIAPLEAAYDAHVASVIDKGLGCTSATGHRPDPQGDGPSMERTPGNVGTSKDAEATGNEKKTPRLASQEHLARMEHLARIAGGGMEDEKLDTKQDPDTLSSILLRMGHVMVDNMGNGWCGILALSELIRLDSPIDLCTKMQTLLQAREWYTANQENPGSNPQHGLSDAVIADATLCKSLDQEVKMKHSPACAWFKLNLMMAQIRTDQYLGTDGTMRPLTTDAWMGDSLLNLYAVSAKVDILVLNMHTLDTAQVRTAKGACVKLGYKPGEGGRNSRSGLLPKTWRVRSQLQGNYWARVSLAVAVNGKLDARGLIAPVINSLVTEHMDFSSPNINLYFPDPPEEGPSKADPTLCGWSCVLNRIMEYLPFYRVLIKKPAHWQWATPDLSCTMEQRLGRYDPACVATLKPLEKKGISLTNATWWKSFYTSVCDLSKEVGILLPAKTSWGYRQYLKCNMDWYEPGMKAFYPRVHFQTGVQSFLASVMEGLSPHRKPPSVDRMVLLLVDHLQQFAWLYRTLLGSACTPLADARRLLRDRCADVDLEGDTAAMFRGKERFGLPYVVLVVAVAHVFRVDVRIVFYRGKVLKEGRVETVNPVRVVKEYYHHCNLTNMAEPLTRITPTQTINLAWLHVCAGARTDTVCKPLFFLLKDTVGVPGHIIHQPSHLRHDFTRSGPPTSTALTLFANDDDDGVMLIGPGDVRMQYFDVRPSGVVPAGTVMMRWRVSRHVPGVVSAKTGRGASRSTGNVWHEIVEVRLGWSKQGLKWQNGSTSLAWSEQYEVGPQQFVYFRDGIYYLDHTPQKCKPDGTPLQSEGAKMLQLVHTHGIHSALRAYAQQQASRVDLPEVVFSEMFDKNNGNKKLVNPPWCASGDFVCNGGSTDELLHGALRHEDVGSNTSVFLPRPDRPLPVAGMRVRTYPGCMDYYLLRYRKSEDFMKGVNVGKVFRLTASEVKLVTAAAKGELPDHQAVFHWMFPCFRYIINAPLHEWVPLHDPTSPCHIKTINIDTCGVEKSGFTPACATGITHLRLNRSNLLCPLLYKQPTTHARARRGRNEWKSLDFGWMIERWTLQCVAMDMKGYPLTLLEWLLFGTDGEILFQDNGCSGPVIGGTPPATNPFLRLGTLCPVIKTVDHAQYCVARSFLLLDFVEDDDVKLVGAWNPTLPLMPLHDGRTGTFMGNLKELNAAVDGYYVGNMKAVHLGFDQHYATKVEKIVTGRRCGIAGVAVKDPDTDTGVRTNHCMAVINGSLVDPSDGTTHDWPQPPTTATAHHWLQCVMLFIPLQKIARTKRKRRAKTTTNKRQTVTRTSTTTTTTSTTTSSTVTTTHTFTDNEDMTRQSTGTNDVAFQIFAKTLSGISVPVKVVPTTTVLELKSEIALIENLKVKDIRILCGGKDLSDDHKTLSELGILDVTKITILTRLRGGASIDDDEVSLGHGARTKVTKRRMTVTDVASEEWDSDDDLMFDTFGQGLKNFISKTSTGMEDEDGKVTKRRLTVTDVASEECPRCEHGDAIIDDLLTLTRKAKDLDSRNMSQGQREAIATGMAKLTVLLESMCT